MYEDFNDIIYADAKNFDAFVENTNAVVKKVQAVVKVIYDAF